MVTAAEMLSLALFREGKHAQAFPSFGSERMGAPVMAFCRADDKPIRSREPVSEPDALIIQDATLLHHVNLFQGLGPDGLVILNTTKSLDELGLRDELPGRRLHTLPATEIAREHLGRPVPNVVLIAALAALSGILHLESIEGAVRAKFSGKVADANVRAAKVAWETVVAHA